MVASLRGRTSTFSTRATSTSSSRSLRCRCSGRSVLCLLSRKSVSSGDSPSWRYSHLEKRWSPWDETRWTSLARRSWWKPPSRRHSERSTSQKRGLGYAVYSETAPSTRVEGLAALVGESVVEIFRKLLGVHPHRHRQALGSVEREGVDPASSIAIEDLDERILGDGVVHVDVIARD